MHIQEVTEHFDLDRVVPYFQPIIDLSNNAVWRYECLARLISPGEHTFLPSEFLRLVERQQSVEQLTHRMFNRCAEYFRNVNMAWNINISADDMNSPTLLSTLTEFVSSYPNPKRASLELTAETALANIDNFARFAETCDKLDIGLFIDHFGAKSGNINSLLELPISGVKIAGRLINQLHQDGETSDFVSHINQQGKSRGIAVIAEHIEDEETLKHVRDMNIPFAQGFYFAQPSSKP